MRTLSLLFFFCIICVPLFSQTLTGLWMGNLVNDSNGKEQKYELALSEYRGKVTGYSYTTFFENDHYYYSVKRIKAERENKEWIITDDKMVANNFPEKAANGVKQTSIFTLNQKDSTWEMNGTWKTNQTKIYYSLTGQLHMAEEKDLSKSNLFPHLGDLKLEDDVPFYTPEKRLLSMGKFRVDKTTMTSNNQPNAALKQTTLAPVSIAATPGIEIEEENSTTDQENKQLYIAGRKVNTVETIYFKGDSLTLALYDNGEIDGDTVSVYLNGEPVLSREGLKASAIKKTIYPQNTGEDMQVVLVAENLGKYPPNTGLLVIRDGDAVYQVRFSADLENSPAIIFKKK